jgi:MFS family permease
MAIGREDRFDGETTKTAGPGTGATLSVLLAGQVMANVDTAIVNVAAPSIRQDLQATSGELEFVLSGYLIAYAVLLTVSAKLANKYGYRSVYFAGVLLFTLSSLLCGISTSTVSLIAARIVQGIGAALLVAQVLTGIQLSFKGRARKRALSWFSITLSTASIAGQMLGGALVTAALFGLGWRTIFLINVPVGVLILLLGFRVLPAHSKRSGQTHVDIAGTLALVAALLLLIVPLVFGKDVGWAPWTWLSLGLAVPAAAAFIMIERAVQRRGQQTVVNFAVLRTPAIGWGTAANFAAVTTCFALLLVIAVYLQSGHHYTALESGLALTLWVAAFGAGGPIVSRMSAKRTRTVLVGGYFLLSSSYLLLGAYLMLFGHNYIAVTVILGLAGLGLGLGFNALVHTMTDIASDHWAADISALINTSTEVAAALGIALFGGLYLFLAPGAGATAAVTALSTVALVLSVTAVTAGLAARRACSSTTSR